MSRELPPRLAVTPHAARQLATRQLVMGAALAAIAAACAILQIISASLALPLVVLGGLLAVSGAYTRSVGAAVQALNKALNAGSSGHTADAIALLDYVESTSTSPYVLRLADLQRALLAMRQGDLEAALHRADASIARPVGWVSRDGERLQIAAARGLRAVIRASLGDRSGAEVDIDLVRRDPHSIPQSLARAELAVAMLLERAGERDALGDHLQRARRLLVEHTLPRERALVRAFQRMLKAKATSVYRTGAKRETAPADEPSLADWAAKVAPGAAPFVRAPANAAQRPPAAEIEPVDPAARAAAEERFKSGDHTQKRAAKRLLIRWAGLIVMSFGLWQVIAPIVPSERGAPIDEDVRRAVLERLVFWLSLLPGVLVLVYISVIARGVMRARRLGKQLIAAQVALARGDEVRGEGELKALSDNRAATVAAAAHLALAELAQRRADFAGALSACDAALSRLDTDVARAAAADLLLPSVLAERAAMFAATDATAEARAELALVAERYPSFPYLDAAKLRVTVLLKARQGDVAGAARSAEHRGDLQIDARIEVLADLCRAAAAPQSAGAGEVERLREELRLDRTLHRFIAIAAPAALAAFERLSVPDDEEADSVAMAEADAEAGEALARSERAHVAT